MGTLEDWRKRRPGNREYQQRLLAEMELEAAQYRLRELRTTRWAEHRIGQYLR
jgi:hypothetical protein